MLAAPHQDTHARRLRNRNGFRGVGPPPPQHISRACPRFKNAVDGPARPSRRWPPAPAWPALRMRCAAVLSARCTATQQRSTCLAWVARSRAVAWPCLLPHVTVHGHAKARGRATQQLGAALNKYRPRRARITFAAGSNKDPQRARPSAASVCRARGVANGLLSGTIINPRCRWLSRRRLP